MIGEREKTLVRTLFALFPNATKTSAELNKLWAEMFERHPTDRCEAIINAHRLERRGNDPCPATVKARLAEAARVAAVGAARGPYTNEEHQTIKALRAWAMSAFGQEQGLRMSPREIVEARCIAEWSLVPAELRPEPNTEHNFGVWISMGDAAGMTEQEVCRIVRDVTGCRHTTKYNDLDNREMYRLFAAAVANLNAKEI
jgi:hypothetical protein